MKIRRASSIIPFGLVSITLVLSACSAMPDTMQSNDLSHLSLRDKRMADKHIQVYETQPQGAQSLGRVATKRCQATVFSEKPEIETLLVDMKAQAYRLGANGISGVTYAQQGAVAEGCWNVFTATADMFVLETSK